VGRRFDPDRAHKDFTHPIATGDRYWWVNDLEGKDISKMHNSFNRQNSLKPSVILLDGISGTGKTMIMRLLDLIQNSTAPFFDYQLEQLLITTHLGKIDEITAETLISLLLDQRAYDMALSRNINLRFYDLSSVFKSSKRNSYLKRLFVSDQHGLFENANNSLIIVTHQLLQATEFLTNRCTSRLNRLLCVRHPYYLFYHWLSYANMLGKNWRDFTITRGEDELPWFLAQEELEKNATIEEIAATCVSSLTIRQDIFLEQTSDILVIDFERFVLSPLSYIASMENLFDLDHERIVSVLKRENIPRQHINNSKRSEIYFRYNAQKLNTNLDHRQDYLTLKNRVRSLISSQSFELLELAAEKYERRFGTWYD
jgi:hypothetical protein